MGSAPGRSCPGSQADRPRWDGTCRSRRSRRGIGGASSSKVTARPVTPWSPPESCISSVVRSREGPTSRISTSRGETCVNPWSVTFRSEIEPESPSTSIGEGYGSPCPESGMRIGSVLETRTRSPPPPSFAPSPPPSSANAAPAIASTPMTAAAAIRVRRREPFFSSSSSPPGSGPVSSGAVSFGSVSCGGDPGPPVGSGGSGSNGAATTVWSCSPEGSCIPIARAAASIIAVHVGCRSFGSFAIPRATASSSAGATSGRRAEIRGGGSCRWPNSVATSVPLSNGTTPVRHWIQHARERVLVGASVDLPTLDLFGRHVVHGAHEGPGLREPALGGRVLGQPEIGQVRVLLLLVLRHQDVRRLDVAVDQARAVRGVQGARDRPQEPDRPFGRKAPLLRDERSEVGPPHVTHRDEQLSLDLARLVDRHDVRMVQPRGELGLPNETAPERLVVGQLVGEDLDRDAALEPRILRQVDDAHPATAEL